MPRLPSGTGRLALVAFRLALATTAVLRGSLDGDAQSNLAGTDALQSLSQRFSRSLSAPATFKFPGGPGVKLPDASRPIVITGSAKSPSADGSGGLLYVAKEAAYAGNQGGSAPAITGFTRVANGVASNEVGVQGTIYNENTVLSQGIPGGTASATALAAQAICGVAGCSATWGSVISYYDTSGQRDPAHPQYGLEIDNYAKGTDSRLNRLILQLVCGTPDNSTGVPNICGHGALFSADGRHGRFVNMIDGATSHATNGIVLGGMTIRGVAFNSPGFQVDGPTGDLVSHQITSNTNIVVPSGGALVARRDGAIVGQINYTSPSWYFDALEPGGGWSWRGPGYANVATLTKKGDFSVAAYRETLRTPANSSARCDPGEFTDDADYHYVCVAPNRWKRVALSNF